MGNFFKKCLPPSKPYIEYTPPSGPVTTTIAPDSKYFLIPSSGTICPPQFLIQGNCNCGSLFISKNFGLNIDGNIVKFSHNQDVLLNNNQAFIATTDKLNIGNINDIDIDLFTDVLLKNKIQVIIKIKETNKPIAYSVIGNDSQSYTINTINLCLQEPASLSNESLQVEFYSLCYNIDKNDCCDKLPSTITLINTTTLLPCSTTTTTTSTTTLPPFCSRFNLPNLFYATVTAGYPLEGQEKVSLFTKNGNVYSTSGTFPCGPDYSLSMTCDPITEKFYYDGSIDCCDQNTKTIISETSRPLIIPGAVLPPLIFYENCENCNPTCTSTTTSTTQAPDCCNWNGEGQQIEFSCNNQLYSVPFYKIGPNLFEANGQIGCGDTVNAIYRCNPNIKYDGPSSCSDKWEPVSISVPCAVNPRFTGNILQPCECDKPPVYEWEADDLSNCECCGGCPLGDGASGIYLAGRSGSTCWNEQDGNAHLFFASCSGNNMYVKGIGLVGEGAKSNAIIENSVTYAGQNITIKTDNQPRSAIIRTNYFDCVHIFAQGSRNTGSADGWQHPNNGVVVDPPDPETNPCEAKTPGFLGGQGAYSLTISNIDPNGPYEVHIRLGCSTSGPLFPACPSRCGTYFYIIGDNNGTGGNINGNPILSCGDGPMIEKNILTDIENYANWVIGSDCVVWLLEGWVVERDDSCPEPCRLIPELEISPSEDNGSGAILEPSLTEVFSYVDNHGCPVSHWKLDRINVLNSGTGYTECQAVNISLGIDTISESQTCDQYLTARAFMYTDKPINPTIKILDANTLEEKPSGAILNPIWKFLGKYDDPPYSSRFCEIKPFVYISGPPKNLYFLDEFIIVNSGAGYSVDDFIEISFPSGDGSYPYGGVRQGGAYATISQISAVDGSGSILGIDIFHSGQYFGSLTSSIEAVNFIGSGESCVNAVKPLGYFYKNNPNCISNITGLYPILTPVIDGGGDGESLEVIMARRGCSEEEYFGISGIIINNGGSGYIDGQAVSFTVSSGIMEVAAEGTIYVDSQEPKDPIISFPYNFNGSGAVLEPIFFYNGSRVDYNNEINYGRPSNQCSYIPLSRKLYKVSSINIIDGGYGYASGDYIEISFPSANSGINIGYGPHIYVDGVDLNGTITSMFIDGDYYFYGGSLTASIGSILMYDSAQGCTLPAGKYKIQ